LVPVDSVFLGYDAVIGKYRKCFYHKTACLRTEDTTAALGLMMPPVCSAQSSNKKQSTVTKFREEPTASLSWDYACSKTT